MIGILAELLKKIYACCELIVFGNGGYTIRQNLAEFGLNHFRICKITAEQANLFNFACFSCQTCLNFLLVKRKKKL